MKIKVRYAFKNKPSPLQFIIKEYNHNQKFFNPIYYKNGWTYTLISATHFLQLNLKLNNFE